MYLFNVGEDWKVTVQEVEEDGITVKPDTQEVYLAKNVAIASGHHAKPTIAKFMGQDSFTGLFLIPWQNSALKVFEK